MAAARPLLAWPYGQHALTSPVCKHVSDPLPEPWLRGPLPGVHPLIMPVFFSFAQVREDLARHTAGLTREQIWQPVTGASLGFHLKHIAGSVDRLATYLIGRQLSDAQLASFKQ